MATEGRTLDEILPHLDFPDADDFTGVLHPENEDATFAVGERAYRASEGRQVSEPAFELDLPTFAPLDALDDLRPLHPPLRRQKPAGTEAGSARIR